MKIIESVVKGGAEGVFKGIGEFAKDVRAAITGKAPLSAEQQTDLLTRAAMLEQQALNVDVFMAQLQTQVNAIEAQSGSLFKGGWRPAAGWTCVIGLFYAFILRQVLMWIINMTIILVQWHSPEIKLPEIPPLPPVDIKDLLGLLMGLLGLGGFRAYEKVRGTASR